MTALVKYRDLLSAGLALGFVVFVLASVAIKTLTGPASGHVEPTVETIEAPVSAPELP